MKIEWDDRKAASNLGKHKLTFDQAAQVFDDPLHRSIEDPFAQGERRFTTMGLVRDVGLVLVVHTLEGDEMSENATIRIISARRPLRHERRAFEDD